MTHATRGNQAAWAALLVAAALLPGQVRADTLLDNGTLGGAGRTVSAQWTIFQPFTVTGDGWFVTTIGVDGFVSNSPAEAGMLGVLLPESSSGEPDEDHPIGDAVYFMGEPMSPPEPQWRDEPFDVALPAGRYWMRWTANHDIGYFGAVWRGVSGEPSFSRNEFTQLIVDSDPTALRVCGTPLPLPCDADVDGDGDVGFGDLLAVLSAWGPCPGCPEDIDGDDDVGFGDLLAVLAEWGPCV